MKIVIVSLMQGSSWGGSEELWSKVAEYALLNQDELHISVKKWDNLHPTISTLIAKGAIPHFRKNFNLPIQFFKRQFFKLLNALKRPDSLTWDFLEKVNPDTVLISLGGPYDLYYHTGLTDYLLHKKVPFSIIQQFNTENYVLPEPMRVLNHELYLKAKAAYFVSNRNKEATERNLILRLPNSKLVFNPVNLSNIEPLGFPLVTNGYNFACVARLEAFYKGQDLLIAVLSNPIWLNREWTLNIYGEGPDMNYLKALAQFYGIVERVIFHGHTNDVRKIWEKNHLLILPSIAEGKPLALVEAMHCCRPAVVTDVGGSGEMVQNEITGFIVPAPTLNLLHNTLELAWSKREYWANMGLKAKESVVEKVNLEAFKEIYNESINLKK
jgi:glycosyltransferase involved in cell wall biosynthesis